MDEDHDDEAEKEIACRHLLLCRTIWFTGDLDDGFSLGRLVVHLRPQEHRFPFICETRLFLFCQLYGDPGEYTARIELIPITMGEDGEQVEGEHTPFGPWLIPLYGQEFVESFAFPLYKLPFGSPGIYEFRLVFDELPDWWAAERVEVKE